MADDILRGAAINSKGFGTISKLAMQDKRLHIAAKAIYAYFNSYAGGGDTCFPTRTKICYDLGISNDTFSKYLKQLVINGYIEVEQIKENGRFSHNVYTICSTILPCPKISDTENIGNDNLDTNINSLNINNNFNINSKKSAASRFTPPTVEEVQAYCRERQNNVDPQRFIDYYTARGWLIGKNKMKDWKAAVRTWERSGYNNSSSRSPAPQRQESDPNADLNRKLLEMIEGGSNNGA